MKPVVVVGSINMDLVSITDRAPAPGETVFGRDFQMFSGGKGANQAVAAARIGCSSILLGKVGNDIFGSQLLDTLAIDGVDTSQVERIDGSTGTASIVVDSRGENSIIVTPSANLQVSPEYLAGKRHILRQAGIILTQLEIPLPTVSYLAELCEEYAVPLMVDPAPAQDLDAEIMSRITWFTPNQTEADFYAGCSDGSQAAAIRRLLNLGVRNVILKMGSAGVVIASSGAVPTLIEAFSVEAVDTTAAGDCFNGAFAAAQLRGLNIEDSARFAAAAAAISVTRKGAQASLPTGEEVERYLRAVARPLNQETAPRSGIDRYLKLEG